MTSATVSISRHIATNKKNSENTKFSEREMEIIAYLIRRMPSKEIAADLDISHNTVRNHIKNIYYKTGCSSRRAIIDHVLKTGIDINLTRELVSDDIVILKKINRNQRKLLLTAFSLITVIICMLMYNKFLL